MSTPPKAGKRMSVRVDDALSDDLAALMRTGMTASDAVRLAVGFLAHGYRDLWAHGVYPDGVAPARMRLTTPPHDARRTASDVTG
ncbi:hypothetical protein ACFQ8C_13365 [Streptomyces sp. NPDC056503]|uniref:hypothetical protein n=1 Tax=Streptomyces sp. NPDC056503 TaxID=3345842 RepID=UPI0036820440